MMSVIVRGVGAKGVCVSAAEACLTSSTDMVLWHASARRLRTSASARLVHEIGRRSTMAGLHRIDAREGRFLHCTLGHSDQAVNNRCGSGSNEAQSGGVMARQRQSADRGADYVSNRRR